jgi:hypothetical protein
LGLVIDVDKSSIPYRFEIPLAKVLYEIEFQYNPGFDFFTVDLYKNKEPLVYGEKVVYGMPLFHDFSDGRFPDVTITPFDESGKASEVNWQTLGETVFLFIEAKEGEHV